MRSRWPIAALLELPSMDEGACWTVREVLKYKAVSSPYYQTLRKAMERNGQTWPVLVAPERKICEQAGHWDEGSEITKFGNGHHRLMLAIELGWTEMEVTDDLYESGEDWSSGELDTSRRFGELKMREHGAAYAFNRQWTSVTATRNVKTGEKWKWTFRCGCGAEKDFTARHFLDPFEAANTAREHHVCEQHPDPATSAADGIARVAQAGHPK